MGKDLTVHSVEFCLMFNDIHSLVQNVHDVDGLKEVFVNNTPHLVGFVFLCTIGRDS